MNPFMAIITGVLAAITVCPHSLERAFLSRFTNSRCAGYILFLDTYPDILTNLIAAKTGFPLVKS
ncbi:MAG: hypothetical protein DSZ23_04670 [Thermodesulfatator sp.]|nr:MAG: hypothetical protein DSZ23_04670 [Thermodesulfatator sp.]